MQTCILYRQNPRWSIWAAFALAIAIHFAAVAIAGRHPSLPEPAPGGDDTRDVFIEPEAAPLTTPPHAVDPLPPPPDETPALVEPQPSRTATPRRLLRPPPAVPSEPSRPTGNANLARGGRAFVLSGPRPEYPYEARRQKLTGAGVALISVDPATGAVSGVAMSRSTGSAVLDNATLAALRRWWFKAGTVARVECPITYTLTGVSL